MFPLFIMFSILFVVQLMFSQEEEKKKAFGFNALAVMGVLVLCLATRRFKKTMA
jgi:low temperature requirement protein LtrA